MFCKKKKKKYNFPSFSKLHAILCVGLSHAIPMKSLELCVYDMSKDEKVSTNTFCKTPHSPSSALIAPIYSGHACCSTAVLRRSTSSLDVCTALVSPP